MSAQVLRDAATRLREMAEAATPGPWTPVPSGDDYLNRGDVAGPGEPGNRYVICEWAGVDAPYIATMSPVLGAALADWLDQCATRIDKGHNSGSHHAHKIARLILRGVA